MNMNTETNVAGDVIDSLNRSLFWNESRRSTIKAYYTDQFSVFTNTVHFVVELTELPLRNSEKKELTTTFIKFEADDHTLVDNLLKNMTYLQKQFEFCLDLTPEELILLNRLVHRSKEDNLTTSEHQKLSEMIHQAPKLNFEMKFYRGSDTAYLSSNSKVIRTLHTSADVNIARRFGNILYEIVVPAGTPILAICVVWPREAEFLLSSGGHVMDIRSGIYTSQGVTRTIAYISNESKSITQRPHTILSLQTLVNMMNVSGAKPVTIQSAVNYNRLYLLWSVDAQRLPHSPRVGVFFKQNTPQMFYIQCWPKVKLGIFDSSRGELAYQLIVLRTEYQNDVSIQEYYRRGLTLIQETTAQPQNDLEKELQDIFAPSEVKSILIHVETVLRTRPTNTYA
jgi:hypothetical protein